MARERTRHKQREAEELAVRRAEVEALFPRHKRKGRAEVPTAAPDATVDGLDLGSGSPPRSGD